MPSLVGTGSFAWLDRLAGALAPFLTHFGNRMSLLDRVIRKFRRKKPAPGWRRKVNVLETAIDFSVANNVRGDYLEFGVFQGRSFSHAFHYWYRTYAAYRASAALDAEGFLSFRPRFFAFDSFEGLPPVEQAPLPLHWRGPKAMACPLDSFRANLAEAKVDLTRVTTVQGYYDQSLTAACRQQHALDRAAIVHVDCDLYESTVSVLDFITPLVVDGTVLIFDDWFYYQGHPNRGEQGAFHQWLARNPQLVTTELTTVYPASAWIVNQR